MPRDVFGETSSAPASIYGTDPAATGLWFDSAAGVGGLGTSSVPDSFLVYAPIVVSAPGSLDAVKLNCTLAATGQFLRFGIYADGGGKPFGPRLWQSDPIDCQTTTGDKLAAIDPVIPTEAPRLWWVAMRFWGSQSNATFRKFGGISPHTFGKPYVGGNDNNILYRTDAAGTSTLPDPATHVDNLTYGFANAPLIRVAP